MSRCRLIIAFLLICAAPLSAGAASLAIDGQYGDKLGCQFGKTEESTGDSDFILLTRDAIRSSVAFCSIKSIDKTSGNTVSTTISCADEGEAGETTMTANVIRTGHDSYRVDFSDGTSWGPFKRCK